MKKNYDTATHESTFSIGRLIVSIIMLAVALGACYGAYKLYGRTTELRDELAVKQAETQSLKAEKEQLAQTITEQGKTLSDLDKAIREAENRLSVLQEADK